ncbi:MAG: type IV pilus assembly protein PilB, partial [Ilumatobacter sp.]
MALRKPKTDDAAQALGGGIAVAEPPTVGAAAEQCMATGQELVQAGHLDAEKLAVTLQEANGDLLVFSNSLLTKAGVSRNELSQAIGAACQVAVGDSNPGEIDEELVLKVAEGVARTHKVMPVSEENGSIVLYAADPSPSRRQLVESATGQQFVWKASDYATVTAMIEQMYRSTADLEQILGTFNTEDAQRQEAETIAQVSLDDQAPVVQLVARIVSQALRDRASDIHIEPLDERLRIRFRVDGHLLEAFSLPLSAHNALISRLKIMSEMNIVEKRAPQDGQFSTKVDGREIDVRVASVSTVFGEKIVMRILDKSKSMVGLGELGMPKETYKEYAKLVHAPFGMVICAGPTGAGKTTTLYATLLEINDTGKNVTTVEDPVEYVFPGINQV